jgi:spore coat protein A
MTRIRSPIVFMAIVAVLTLALSAPGAFAAPLPGGTLDPLTIPKYVTPLVIPPVMNNAGTANDYDIAVRQFQQQILPGGIWAILNPAITTSLPATTVWSYGPASDPLPDASGVSATIPAGIAPAPNSQFNYPAYTVENMVNTTTTVDWINDLKDPVTGNFLPHLLPVDRTLHWANPEQLVCMDPAKTKDCRPADTNGAILQQPYLGPVPVIVHVHGAHVGPESDGYPEAWYLPAATNIPGTYATQGTLVNQYGTSTNITPGVANFTYPNTQPSTTLWYHDHTLGMTRLNVYAGPAGFWLIREPGGGETGLVTGTLPGPAPVAGQAVLDLNVPGNSVRAGIREIPIAIQDRSFNADGSLFYPKNRAFFEGLGDGSVPSTLGNTGAGLNIDFDTATSDIAPIWNPEAFFNTMVVNGTTWPVLEVAPALYRFRLLNGCNSRFLNLSLKPVDPLTGQPITLRVTETRLLPNGKTRINTNAKLTELPFYQIGAEQSLLPQVVMVKTGSATPLPGDGTVPSRLTAAASKDQALLMGLAERADVLVDFRNLPNGTVVQMFNTAPDAPFGGFPDIPADPGTTGQVMQFVVNTTLNGESPTDPVQLDGVTPNPNAATAPNMLALSLPDPLDPANGPVVAGARDLALLEEESALVCVTIDALTGFITQDLTATPDLAVPGQCLVTGTTTVALSFPFAPKAAVLGTNGSLLAGPAPLVTLWSDPIATNPAVGATETWELWNHTVDGHPIHLHLVKFKVVNRQVFDPLTGALVGPVLAPAATEAGWKDTVIAYPGEVTRVNATFDIAGLYVWHCHIVEHEDNEMMVPYVVGTPGVDFPDPNGTIAGLLPLLSAP